MNLVDLNIKISQSEAENRFEEFKEIIDSIENKYMESTYLLEELNRLIKNYLRINNLEIQNYMVTNHRY